MLSTINLLKRAVVIYWAHPLQFLAIAALAFPMYAAPSFAREPWYFPVSVIVVGLPHFVVAALTYAAAAVIEGTEPSFSESYKEVGARLKSLAGVIVRYFGVIFLLALTIVGIPFAIYTFVRWFFGIQFAVLHGLDTSQSLQSSSRLVQSLWWPVFGALVFIGVLVAIPPSVPIIIFRSFATRYLLISSVIAVFELPLMACFYTLLFTELNARKAQFSPMAPGGSA